MRAHVAKVRGTNLRSMRVELLFWAGCPSHPRALADLREAMAERGLDPESVLVREVDSEEEADRERFVGSPTIRLDGVDVVPAQEEPYGLNCRIYRRRDGRISPTPDPQDLREALARALAREAGGPSENLAAVSAADRDRQEETR